MTTKQCRCAACDPETERQIEQENEIMRALGLDDKPKAGVATMAAIDRLKHVALSGNVVQNNQILRNILPAKSWRGPCPTAE